MLPFITFALFLLLVLGVVLIVPVLMGLQRLRGLIDALTERVAALEESKREPVAPPVPQKVAIPPSPLLAEQRDSPPRVPDERKLVPPAGSVPPPLPVATPPPLPPTATPFNWEAFMGVKLFAWLGGLALFLGVVFLVKYSFENNLITPFSRVVMGGAFAIGLIALGWRLARGHYRVTAQSLCATGIVILYADLFAAHSFYGLISLTTAFFAMSAVTLFSFFLAVNLGAQVIVILGLLGGFLTPVLLPSGSDNAPALFLYIALLDLGVAAVALRQRWHYLLFLAAIGTALTQLGWAFEYFEASTGGRAFWIFLGFDALFLAVFFLNAVTAIETAWPLDDSRGRSYRFHSSRFFILDFGRAAARQSSALFLQLRLSRRCRVAGVARNRSRPSRDRARGWGGNFRPGRGVDRVVWTSGAIRTHRSP